ncbi:MAG: 30S ribosomal protein S8 [Thermoflexales bacterium]|nr:30S ribosomal protein S8 [Thermoflexales bacterium]
MSVTDPIGDMLTRVRNASIIGHSLVAMPSSRIKVAIANILKEEGYIQDFEVTQEEGRPQATLRMWLKYVGDRRHRVPAITGVKRVSTPGCRVYSQKGDVPWVLSGMGIAILSTPKGVITGQQARRLGVGGEVLCHVW